MVVYRPWGSYETIVENRYYKVKRLIIYPKKRISLQKHTRRSEHWVIVQGEAWITKGGSISSLYSRPAFINDSRTVALGEIHRIENKGNDDLIIIETQIGEYLEEDDIVRFADDFGRVENTNKTK